MQNTQIKQTPGFTVYKKVWPVCIARKAALWRWSAVPGFRNRSLDPAALCLSVLSLPIDRGTLQEPKASSGKMEMEEATTSFPDCLQSFWEDFAIGADESCHFDLSHIKSHFVDHFSFQKTEDQLRRWSGRSLTTVACLASKEILVPFQSQSRNIWSMHCSMIWWLGINVRRKVWHTFSSIHIHVMSDSTPMSAL